MCQLRDLGFEIRNFRYSEQSVKPLSARSREAHTLTLGLNLILLQLDPAPVGQLVGEHCHE